MTRRLAVHLLLVHITCSPVFAEVLEILRRARDAKYAALGAGVILKRDHLDWELRTLEVTFHRDLFVQSEADVRQRVEDEVLIGRLKELRAKTAMAIFGARALILAFNGQQASGALPRVAYRSIFEDWAGERAWTRLIMPARIPESGSGITSPYQVRLLREYERQFDRRIAEVKSLNAELRSLVQEMRKWRVR